jgi:hypothetical protein
MKAEKSGNRPVVTEVRTGNGAVKACIYVSCRVSIWLTSKRLLVTELN